ncbi:MAG: UDP-N-acetylglucosamine 1-carboxyvinyltransferase [Chloroflexi bacterium]|nr:UDP-N-acetylglucosamine 1-carboxyvinyltransferase [Chloroflexota bacterium]
MSTSKYSDHDCFRIEGGVPLRGAVQVSGAKNAALPAMAAALLTGDDCLLENMPEIDDVVMMAEILRRLGAVVRHEGPGRWLVRGDGVTETVAPSELVVNLRASFLVMGGLLGRFGEAACAAPGGDVLGQRPLDVHLGGFRSLGAEIGRRGDKYYARTPHLRGARIVLDYPSHLGTENIMLAAVLADGTTYIVNAAAEPEIAFLGDMLNSMGAKVSGAGSHTIEIEGVRELHGTRARIIPDRIEAGTYAMAAAATRGDVDVIGAVPRHIDALIFKMREIGVHLTEHEGGLHVRGAERYTSTSIQAVPYPGLATDLQAQVAALLTQAHGVSYVHERVFDNRMMYVGELRKFGAEIVSAGTTAVISGPTQLVGATARSLDIRAGASLMIAALTAEGTSTLTDVYHLDRGYEALDVKLRSLGANVTRVG